MKYLTIFLLLFILSCSGKNLHDEVFYNLEGKPVYLPKNKPLILYVWTGTCIGHKKDLKLLSENYQRLSENYNVVSVAVFMSPEDILQYMKENNLDIKMPLYADPTGKLEKYVRLVYLPATIILSEKGKVEKIVPRIPKEFLFPNREPK